MALIAEELVQEWLNRKFYFTIRGLKKGNHEMDLLAIRLDGDQVERCHYEVSVSMNPVGYITNLPKAAQVELGVQNSGSAAKRSDHILRQSVEAWVEKKFRHPIRTALRDKCLPGGEWKYVFVHGVANYPQELALIGQCGVQTVSINTVIDEIFDMKETHGTSSIGREIIDMIRIRERLRRTEKD
jgi:hypothetical protein